MTGSADYSAYHRSTTILTNASFRIEVAYLGEMVRDNKVVIVSCTYSSLSPNEMHLNNSTTG